MTEVLSREFIAQMADTAAAQWVASPHLPKPRGPFSEVDQPEHAAAWRSEFEVALLRHSAAEGAV